VNKGTVQGLTGALGDTSMEGGTGVIIDYY